MPLLDLVVGFSLFLLFVLLVIANFYKWVEQPLWKPIAVIFTAELGVMLLLKDAWTLHPSLKSFIDASLICIFILPILIRYNSNKSTLNRQVQRIEILIEALPDAVFFKDDIGRWLTVNSMGQKLFKLDGLDWQGKTEIELSLMQPEFAAVYQLCKQSDESTWAMRRSCTFIETMFDSEGKALHFEVTKVPLFEESGKRRALVIIGRDITQRIHAEEEQKLLASLFSNIRQEGIMITTAGDNPCIVRVNDAFSSITGYSEIEVRGKNPRILKSDLHDNEFYRAIYETLADKGAWSGEIWNRRKDGEVYSQWLNISAIVGKDQKFTHYVATFHDLTLHKEQEKKIHLLAYYDALTNLPNRTLLEDRIKLALANAERSEQNIALLFIDLDNFKTVNDNLGHAIGDLLLKTVATRLLDCIREGDTLARLGGDEFVLMLPGFQDTGYASAAASVVAEKIVGSLSEPFMLENHEVVVTPSIGITLFPSDAKDLQNLIKNADTAMYAAKSAGRNTYRFFAPSMNEAVKRRMAVEYHLRHAIERNELYLNYQPQVSKSGEILSAEALLRWNNHELGSVSPAEFIPLAEETGGIIHIGDWVIRSVCEQIRTWVKTDVWDSMKYVAINISARQFQQANFVTRLQSIVDGTGILPSYIELEITETSLMQDIGEVKKRLQELKALGYRVSVDDFGTGYSSLAYLKHFPIDALKIDRSFISDIGIDTNDEAISRTIISLAENLGMKTIAEGVENSTQFAFLDMHGCLAYQGYFFGKPMSADNLSMQIMSRKMTEASESNSAIYDSDRAESLR